MITRDLLVDALERPTDGGRSALDHEAACRVAETCLQILQAEMAEIRREALRHAADRIGPREQDSVGSAPWDVGFRDGKSVAADALRLMSLCA